jgi:hypothetical protein
MGFLSGITKPVSSFFNPGHAYKKAAREGEKHYQQAQAYLYPFAQHGESAYTPLSESMQRLLNPGELQNQWLNDYNMSNQAKYAQERAGTEGTWAANAMGLGGSTPALQAIQAGRERLGAQDEQRYLDQLLQKYLSGAQIAQGIYGTGAQAGSQLGQNSLQHGQNMAQLKYGQEAAPGEMFGNLLKMAASMAGAGFGAGGAMGGGANVGGMGHQLGGGMSSWSTR